MKTLNRRVHILEKHNNASDPYDQFSDEELYERLEQLIFGMGYRRAMQGEIPESELDKDRFYRQGPNVDSTKRELDAYMRLGGYVPNENREED